MFSNNNGKIEYFKEKKYLFIFTITLKICHEYILF